jgi:hypothetical protein
MKLQIEGRTRDLAMFNPAIEASFAVVMTGVTNATSLGRELINLLGGRLARVRYAPIATKFRNVAK